MSHAHKTKFRHRLCSLRDRSFFLQIMSYRGIFLACLVNAAVCLANSFEPFTDLDSSTTFSKNYVCQPIPKNLKLCRNMAYSEMRLPNLLGHETMEEVKQQAGSWVPLVKKKCHKDLQVLLCTLFAPVCVENSPVPIYPCRSLCEAVKAACEPGMKKVGYSWPPMLPCEKFPENEMCVKNQCTSECIVDTKSEGSIESTNQTTGHNATAKTTTCPTCSHELNSETITDLFCGVEFVLKVKIRSVKTARKDLKLMTEKRKRVIYKQGSLGKKDLRRLTLFIQEGKSCTCPHLEEKPSKGKKNKKDFYLLMGGKVGRKLIVSAMYRWPKKQKILRRVSKKFSGNLCT